jgi:hypothetical protein
MESRCWNSNYWGNSRSRSHHKNQLRNRGTTGGQNKKTDTKHSIERYVKPTKRTLPYTPSSGALQLGILTERRVQQGLQGSREGTGQASKSNRAFQGVVTPQIVAIQTETARVLHVKVDWAEDLAWEAIWEISQTATALRPRPALHVLRDEPDKRMLECVSMFSVAYAGAPLPR